MSTKQREGFWESLSHDQVGCGDGGKGGVQMSERGNRVGAAAAEVGKKQVVVKQLIGKLQQKSREKETGLFLSFGNYILLDFR